MTKMKMVTMHREHPRQPRNGVARRTALRFDWECILSQKARNRVRASRTVPTNREQGNPQKKKKK
jgi:hypothetical protein